MEDVKKPDEETPEPQDTTESLSGTEPVETKKHEETATDESQDTPAQEPADTDGDETIAEAEEAAPVSIAEEAANETTIEDDVAADQSQQNKTAKSMSMAVVVAILVALALIGLGYSAFLSESDEGEDDTNSSVEESSTINENPVVEPINSADEVTTEIDELTTEIDALNEELDFDESELSDDTLGL